MKTWTLASAKCWIHRTNRRLRLAIALFGWLGLAAPLFVATERAAAATYTWDSDGADGNGAQDGSGTWSTTSLNWFLNNTTADIGWTNNSTDVALFGVSGGTGGAITVGGNFSVGGIQFAAADSGSFSFSGTQILTLGSSGILVNSGAGSESFASGVAFSLASGQTWTNSSSSLLTIGGNISLANAGAQTLALAGSGDRTLAGNLSNGAGTLALAQSGSGTLTLTGTNSFTGGLSASGGTLKATTSASALGAGSLSLGGAALVLANDTGLNFGNATTVSTSTTITSDRLTSGPGVTETLGTLTMGATTLSINPGANVASGTAGITFGNVSLSGGPTFAVNSGASLQLGQLQFNSHKVSFTKSGAGILVLANPASGMVANDNPPTYQLLISGGTVQANANDVGDQLSADKAPILDINPASGTAAFNSQTFSQGFEHLVLGGGYNFVTSTGAAGTAGTTSNITGTGTITVRLGQIVYNGGLSTATGPTGSTISTNLVNGDGATALTFNIGHVTGNAADATFSGSINAGTANGWTKTGAGIMVLSGNSSTNTGTVNDSQGVLSLQNANALGSTSSLAINPGASTSAFLDLGTGNTSFVRPWGTAAGQITIGNNTASAIDGFQTSSPTGASLNINNGTSAPVWTQSGFQPGTLQLGTTSSLGPLTFVGGITLVSGSTPRPIQVDRGNFTLGAGNANLTSANNYFDAQITQVGSTLNAGTIAKSGTGVLSIAGTSTDATTNSSYVVNNGVLLLSNGATGNAIGADSVSVSTPAAATITAFGGNGSTGGTLTFATSGATTQSHLALGNLILTNSGGTVSAISGSIGTLTTADVTLAAGNYLDYVLGKPGKGSGANAGLGSLLSVSNTSTTNNLTLPAGTGSLILNLADNAGANSQGSIGTGTYKLAAYSGTTGTLTNFTAGNGISTGTFKIGLTPLPNYSTYSLTRTAASNGEIDLAVRAGGPLGVIAADNASNAAYSGGWGAGTGGGSTIGFGNWIDSSSGGSSTHFTTTSPEIDTIGNKSWGSFNSGGVADFNRTINNNLQVGHTLAFDFDNKSVGSGGPSVGVSLRNGTTNLFEFYFNGGATSYSINDNSNSNRNTGIPFTSAGLHLEFTLTAANAYSLAVTPLPSGTTTTLTGNLVGNSSNAINTFRIFDANAGNANNFYINTTNVLLPTWNGQNVGAAGGTFSNSGNWAAHAPVNGGSIAFDGTGSTVTDDSGITSLTNILFNSTGNSAGGPNATVTTNAGTYTLQSTGLTAGTGLTLAAGITNNSTNVQNINFTGTSGAVGLTLSAAQTFNGGAGGLAFGSNTGINLNANALTVQGTGSSVNAVKFGGVLSGTAASSALNKQQTGTLIINAAATYAGSTAIGLAPNTSGGTIQLGIVNGLPVGTTLTFFDNGISRSTLDLHGFSQTIAGLNDGGNNSGLITNLGTSTPTFTLNNSLANFFFGQMTGSLAFAKTGTGTAEFGGADTFTGGAAVKSGSIVVGVTSVGTTSGALGPSANAVTLGDTSGGVSANLLIGRAGGSGPGATGGFTFANNITVQDGNSGTLSLGGQNASGINTFSGNITLGATANTSKDLTLIAAAGGEVDFTGNLLKNGNSAANVAVGNVSNTGAVKLFGASTYTGATNVNNGQLILNPSSSLATSSINVAGGATLSAQASALGLPVSGGLPLAAGSTFDMLDNGVGVLNLNGAGTALTVGGASGTAPSLDFEIGGAASGTDRIAVANNVSVGAIGGKITITPVTGLTNITSGNYNLITSAGGFSGIGGNGFTLNTASLSANGTTYNLSLANSTTTNEILTVTVAAPAIAYWSGTASGSWNAIGPGNVTNWRTGATSNIDIQQIPGPATNVFFATTTPIATNLANTLGADFSIASLTFNAGSAAATIGGENNLTIGAGGIVNNSGNLQTINTNGLTLGAAATFNTGSVAGGGLSIGVLGTSTLANGGNRLTVIGANDSTINSAISGTGDLLKQGTGTLALNDSSTFGPVAAGSTNIFIDGGTVSLGNSNAAGSTANTGRIVLGSSVTTNLNSELSISAAGANIPNQIDLRHFPGVDGAKTIGGANTSGAATYSGDITLHDNVTLRAAAGGTVTFAGAISTGMAGAPYAGEDVFAGIPTGGFNPGPGIMTAGGGTIELTGANTFNGEIIVNNGITLQARGGGTFGSGANNAVRMYGSSTVNIADATSIATTINPHGTPGSDIETVGATNAAATTATYSSSIFLDDNATLSSAVSGANLTFTGSTFDIKNHVLTIGGAGDTNISAVISNSAAGGSLVKTGAGTLTLSAASGNTFSGGAAVGGGTLRASNTSGSATGGGAVNVNSGGTLAGTGFITGPVNINAGGTLAPGNSPGAIHLGATTYNDGGAYRWEISNWTGTQGTDYDFQSTTGALAIAATPGVFPANTFKIDITGLNGSAPGNILNFDNAHSRSWILAEASAGISGFAANRFTLDTSHIADNLAGGTFSLSTANGAGSIQDLVLTFNPGSLGAIGQITAMPSSLSIIKGGSTPFSITVQNASPVGGQDLNFSAAAGTNVIGSIAGPVNVPPQSTSAPQPGLTFNGTAVGSKQVGTFTVSDPNAGNSPVTGAVTVNVFDHATPTDDTGVLGSFAGGTLDLGNIHQGYSAPVASAGSLAVFNGAVSDHRVALSGSGIQSGGPTAGLSLNGIGGGGAIGPGGSAAIKATLAPGLAAGAISQDFTYTFADDSSLNGASTNVGTATITVIGNVYSGQSIWRGRQAFGGVIPQASTNGVWGGFSNWSGGSPGLDPNFAGTDSATFGAQSGNVTVDLAGVVPSLNSLVFNHTGNYTLVDTAATGSLKLSGPSPSIAAAGTHVIAVPLTLTTNTAVAVTTSGDSLMISGKLTMAGPGSTLTKSGGGLLEIDASPVFGSTSHLAVASGTLRFNLSSVASVGSGVTASVSPGATFELAGSASALTDSANNLHRASVANDGTLKIGNGTIAPTTTQQVGAIDGIGSAIATDNASLTANHINQSSLVIGSNATVTIAASDTAGNPLDLPTESPITAFEKPSSIIAGTMSSLVFAPDGSQPSDVAPQALSPDNFERAGSFAVPEPPSWLLAVIAVAAVLLAGAQRRTTATSI